MLSYKILIFSFCIWFSSTNAFTCDNGNTTRILATCDGVDDCGDGSDETTSACNVYCEATYLHYLDGCFGCDGCFVCENDNKIRERLVCDGYDNCGDGSDEFESECYECDDGDFIAFFTVCNGENDCNDGSDEANLACNEYCEATGGCFVCENGNEIRESLVCDGYNNCADGSDETNGTCLEYNITCNGPDVIQCDYGACVSIGNICNEELYDCYVEGRTIESNCFVCDNGNKLYAPTYVCDGRDHCGDGSDETEAVCAAYNITYTCTDDHEFQCDYGPCIDLAYVCDSSGAVYRLCVDGSDETFSACKYMCDKLDKSVLLLNMWKCLPTDYDGLSTSDSLLEQEYQDCTIEQEEQAVNLIAAVNLIKDAGFDFFDSTIRICFMVINNITALFIITGLYFYKRVNNIIYINVIVSMIMTLQFVLNASLIRFQIYENKCYLMEKLIQSWNIIFSVISFSVISICISTPFSYSVCFFFGGYVCMVNMRDLIDVETNQWEDLMWSSVIQCGICNVPVFVASMTGKGMIKARNGFNCWFDFCGNDWIWTFTALLCIVWQVGLFCGAYYNIWENDYVDNSDGKLQIYDDFVIHSCILLGSGLSWLNPIFMLLSILLIIFSDGRWLIVALHIIAGIIASFGIIDPRICSVMKLPFMIYSLTFPIYIILIFFTVKQISQFKVDVIGILLVAFDEITDIVVIIYFFNTNDYLYAIIQIFCIVSGNIFAAVSNQLFGDEYKELTKADKIFSFFGFGRPWFIIKSWVEKNNDDNNDVMYTNLSKKHEIFAIMYESFPSIVLTIYAQLVAETFSSSLIFSIAVSSLNISFSTWKYIISVITLQMEYKQGAEMELAIIQKIDPKDGDNPISNEEHKDEPIPITTNEADMGSDEDEAKSDEDETKHEEIPSIVAKEDHDKDESSDRKKQEAADDINNESEKENKDEKSCCMKIMAELPAFAKEFISGDSKFYLQLFMFLVTDFYIRCIPMACFMAEVILSACDKNDTFCPAKFGTFFGLFGGLMIFEFVMNVFIRSVKYNTEYSLYKYVLQVFYVSLFSSFHTLFSSLHVLENDSFFGGDVEFKKLWIEHGIRCIISVVLSIINLSLFGVIPDENRDVITVIIILTVFYAVCLIANIFALKRIETINTNSNAK